MNRAWPSRLVSIGSVYCRSARPTTWRTALDLCVTWNPRPGIRKNNFQEPRESLLAFNLVSSGILQASLTASHSSHRLHPSRMSVMPLSSLPRRHRQRPLHSDWSTRGIFLLPLPGRSLLRHVRCKIVRTSFASPRWRLDLLANLS